MRHGDLVFPDTLDDKRHIAAALSAAQLQIAVLAVDDLRELTREIAVVTLYARIAGALLFGRGLFLRRHIDKTILCTAIKIILKAVAEHFSGCLLRQIGKDIVDIIIIDARELETHLSLAFRIVIIEEISHTIADSLWRVVNA